MSEIKLFRYSGNEARELKPRYAQMEKGLQQIIEKHLECFLGIRLLAHEYRTGGRHRGFIDSLGLDENGYPVIIEYKRHNNENVICQGLFYLDWLMDHQAQFALLAQEKLGPDNLPPIEFAGSRVLCIASSFSRYDEQAIMQINKNVELIRYRFFEPDLLMLEMLMTSLSVFLSDSQCLPGEGQIDEGPVGMPAALQERIRAMTQETENLYLELLAFAENLGEDVSVKFLKHYVALARLKNFTCIQPLKNSLKLWLNLDPNTVPLEEGFSRDVTSIGHHASSCKLEIEVRDMETLAKAQPLIELAYQQN